MKSEGVREKERYGSVCGCASCQRETTVRSRDQLSVAIFPGRTVQTSSSFCCATSLVWS